MTKLQVLKVVLIYVHLLRKIIPFCQKKKIIFMLKYYYVDSLYFIFYILITLLKFLVPPLYVGVSTFFFFLPEVRPEANTANIK